MRRQLTSLALMTLGVLALIFGMTVGPLATTASAMPALQPSPRPTLQPTPDFATATPTTVAPTATAAPPAAETEEPEKEPTAVPMGRVTGTVIDLRTNAPVPNVLVTIGDAVVLSDASGNYDRWVESGYYRLALELSGQGAATQGPQEIAVGPGDTVVVHLFFTSPAPTAAAARPTSAPAAPVPTSVASPMAGELPVLAPPTLPETSSERAVPAGLPARAENAAPGHLPHTAAPVQLTTPGMWIFGGSLLLAFGVALQYLPRRRRAAQQALLGELLSRQPRAGRRNPDELLRDLLDRDM